MVCRSSGYDSYIHAFVHPLFNCFRCQAVASAGGSEMNERERSSSWVADGQMQELCKKICHKLEWWWLQ
jgi:hypothetical protein